MVGERAREHTCWTCQLPPPPTLCERDGSGTSASDEPPPPPPPAAMTMTTTTSSTMAAINAVKIAFACSFVTFFPQRVREAMLSHQLVDDSVPSSGAPYSGTSTGGGAPGSAGGGPGGGAPGSAGTSLSYILIPPVRGDHSRHQTLSHHAPNAHTGARAAGVARSSWRF